MDQFRIRSLTESDLTQIIKEAGGVRAHPDANSRDVKGADYLLSNSVIELKGLDDDSLAKTERQKKLAILFRENVSNAPVIVLDRANLTGNQQRNYDHIIEGPIKSAVASARKQIKQSRIEFPNCTHSILFLINNGYTALNHDELVRLVADRVRKDTDSIDGVIVGGCYFYSDGFDHFFIWPLEYVPIKIKSYPAFKVLNDAWNAFSEKFMTRVVRGELDEDLLKGPVVDCEFEREGVTFVKPAPPLGFKSDFYRHGRPRKNSTGLEKCPPVAAIIAGMTRTDWESFRHVLPEDPGLLTSHQDWLREEQKAYECAEPLKPLVRIPVNAGSWLTWCEEHKISHSLQSVHLYALSLFESRIQSIISGAREIKESGLTPIRYIIVITDEIGQDRANDLSHIAIVRLRPYDDPVVKPLIENARIFHEYALALASAYAIAHNIDAVMWKCNKRYAWI